jgi:hypothetical protein
MVAFKVHVDTSVDYRFRHALMVSTMTKKD